MNLPWSGKPSPPVVCLSSMALVNRCRTPRCGGGGRPATGVQGLGMVRHSRIAVQAGLDCSLRNQTVLGIQLSTGGLWTIGTRQQRRTTLKPGRQAGGRSAPPEVRSLTDLAKASFDELQLVKGIGKSKAAAIKSAFLLAQRLSKESYKDNPLSGHAGAGRRLSARAKPSLYRGKPSGSILEHPRRLIGFNTSAMALWTPYL